MDNLTINKDNHPSKLSLDRLINDDLSQDERKNIDIHIMSCEQCRMYCEVLRDERNRVTSQFPDFKVLHSAYRKPSESPVNITYSLKKWFGLPAFYRPAALFGLLLIVAVPLFMLTYQKDTSEFTAKGGPVWTLYAHDTKYFSQDTAINVQAGDSVQLLINCQKPLYINILYKDDDKKIELYCCKEGVRLAPPIDGMVTAVPFSIILDDTWNTQTMYCIASDEPLIEKKTLKMIKRYNRNRSESGLPRGVFISVFKLHREIR